MAEQNYAANTTKKAFSAPLRTIPNLSTYYTQRQQKYLIHSFRFEGKSILEILINEKSFCQYCYHKHKLERNYMTTLCDCGKIHEKCIAHYIRRNWKDVDKSERFPYFYKIKCKKCRKGIYFKDDCKENVISCGQLKGRQIKILTASILLIILLLGLIVLFSYLASINETSGLKALLAFVIIFLFVVVFYGFKKFIWNLIHTRFYQASDYGVIEAVAPKQKVPIQLNNIIIQNMFYEKKSANSSHSRSTNPISKGSTSKFLKYNKKKPEKLKRKLSNPNIEDNNKQNGTQSLEALKQSKIQNS